MKQESEAPVATQQSVHWTLWGLPLRGVRHASRQAVFHASAFFRSDGGTPSAPAVLLTKSNMLQER